MNWWLALLIIGIVVCVGVAIAFLVHKTFENMEKTSDCFEQIAKDLIKINELVQEAEELLISLNKLK